MKFLSRSICAASVCAVLAGLSASALAWDKWDAFKAANVNESFRVVDYSDNRRITTSEGQSYAMFFALVAGDKDAFDKLLVWTENNLASGDITKYKPAWLWGKHGSSWGIIDSNNAADSDMWIAYCLLEAGRLWDRPDYTAKGKAMMDLLKKDVRDVKGLGKVLLPGYKGFEQENFVTLNPSYYPVFIMRRFAMEDKDWMQERIYDLEGDLRTIGRLKPGPAVNYLRKSVGYDDYLREYAQLRRMEPEELFETADKLLESASAFDTAEQWKEHAASYEEELKARSRANSKSQEGVTLSTMHSAKGLEYPVVFVTDVNEGVIPHHKAAQPADLEEERRLFYVALTRAKDRLHLFAVKERYHRKQEPSRFLKECLE